MEEKNIIEDISKKGKKYLLQEIKSIDITKDDCYELAALFFVYKFLFMGECDGMCNIFENFKK